MVTDQKKERIGQKEKNLRLQIRFIRVPIVLARFQKKIPTF
jgi:hypothetical protein